MTLEFAPTFIFKYLHILESFYGMNQQNPGIRNAQNKQRSVANGDGRANDIHISIRRIKTQK
jgi:hypothetical protein